MRLRHSFKETSVKVIKCTAYFLFSRMPFFWFTYLRRISNVNSDSPSKTNSNPNTRIVTRNKLGFWFFSFFCFISSSHAAQSLSPSTSDLWSTNGLYRSFASYSGLRALPKTGNIQLEMVWDQCIYVFGRGIRLALFGTSHTIETYQKHRYEQQLALSRGLLGSSLLFIYSITGMIQWHVIYNCCKDFRFLAV